MAKLEINGKYSCEITAETLEELIQQTVYYSEVFTKRTITAYVDGREWTTLVFAEKTRLFRDSTVSLHVPSSLRM
jgi:hypothetical protein